MNYSSIRKTISVITNMHTTLNNVDIYFHRGATATNGNCILINAGDPNDRVWLGLVEAKATHEAGHIAHTCFNIFEGAKGAKLQKSEMLKWVLNTIEDVRMETCCIAHLPGSYWVFNKMTNLLFEEGYWTEVTEKQPLSMHLQSFLLYAGRGLGVDGQSHLTSKGLDAKQFLINQGVPSAPLDKIENRMANWGKLVDTDDAFLEAEMIVRLLQECQQVIQEQDQNQGGDQSGSQGGDQAGSQGGDQEGSQGGDQEGSQSGDQDGSQGGDQDGSQGGDQDGDQDGSQGGDQDGSQTGAQSGGKGSSQGNPLAFEDLDQMAKMFDDIHEQLSEGIDKAAESSKVSEEVIDACQQEILSPLRSTNSQAFDLVHARTLSRGLTRCLESAMWSKSQKEVYFDDSGSDFDQELLAGVPAGNNRIFYTESEVTTQQSSMVILVDQSGSMNRNDLMLIANNSTAACAYALESVGVEVGIIHFDNEVSITKKFSDDINQAMDRMGQVANGGTHTHRALQAAHRMMAQSSRPRKQVLVITDGEPCCVNSVAYHAAELKRYGIDVASIQIEYSGNGGIGNKTVLSDIDELQVALSDLISKGALDSIQIG